MIRKMEKVYGLDLEWKEVERAIKEGRLLTIDLELSRRCNLRCIYCYSNGGEPLEGELSFEEVCDLIDQAIDLGIKRVSIVGGGEPLIYPDFFRIAEYIREKNIPTIVFTNGTVISEEIANRLSEFKISVVVKLNSFNKETQDYLAGGIKGTSERISQGLNNLLNAGYPNNGIQLGIETVICRQNIRELPHIWLWARKRGIIPYFETLTPQGRARLHPLDVSPKEIKGLFEELSDMDREYFGFRWEPKPPIAGLTCNRCYYSCLITSNGNVTPCAGVDITIGNIRKDSLSSIIKNSYLLKGLRNLRENIKGPCRDCNQNPYCYGCRGVAYQMTGDPFASDPLCWRNG